MSDILQCNVDAAKRRTLLDWLMQVLGRRSRVDEQQRCTVESLRSVGLPISVGWPSRPPASSPPNHDFFCHFLQFWILIQLRLVVGICGKRGNDFDAIGYGNLLRCPCRSQFRALIGRLWIPQGQSAPRIDLDVLAGQAQSSRSSHFNSIRLDHLDRLSHQTEPQSRHHA